MLSAARLNEVAGMGHAELTDDGAIWVIPPARTKNHRQHSLALSPLLRETIASAPRVASASGLVFTISGAPLTAWSHIKARLDRKMLEIARAERGTGAAIPRFTLHDLRRTAASTLQRLGVNLETIERALNHRSGSFAGVVGTYQTDLLEDDTRDAMARLARFIPMVADVKLHGAHEKFLKGGNDEDNRKSRQTFLAAVAEGGERWTDYLNILANIASGKQPPKVASLTAARSRRGR